MVRSCGMSPERLEARVDCIYMVIHPTALSHLPLSYWSKPKELTPVNFEDCCEGWGSSSSPGDVYGASIGFFYHWKIFSLLRKLPAESERSSRGQGWRMVARERRQHLGWYLN